MPIKKSSIKDMKRIVARTQKNRAERSKLRTIKKAVVNAASKEEGAEKLRMAASIVDKAAKKNLIHRGKANRIKSRLAKKVNAM